MQRPAAPPRTATGRYDAPMADHQAQVERALGNRIRKLERELTAAKGAVTVDAQRWPPAPRVDHQADIRAKIAAAREKATQLSERLRRRPGLAAAGG